MMVCYRNFNGIEYFEGDVNEMIRDIIELVYKINIYDKDNVDNNDEELRPKT